MVKDFRNYSETELQDRLIQRGWVSLDDDDFPRFERAYARVNTLLGSTAWRDVIAHLPSELDKKAPYLQRGLGIGTKTIDTEVKVEIMGRSDVKSDLMQVSAIDRYFRKSGFEDIEPDALNIWLDLKEHSEGLVVSTKEYFEQDKRSSELRSLSLEIIKYAEILVASDGADKVAVSTLMDLNSRLVELSIVPEMHVGSHPRELVGAVKRAEWIAGQLRYILDRYSLIGSSESLASMRNDTSGLIIIGPDRNAETVSLVYLLISLSRVKELLDADAE